MTDAAAAVLSGGRSSRMGGEKGLQPFLGRPLIERPLAALRRVFGEVLIVSARPADYAGLGARVVPDRLPGLGPLGGMHAALRACPGRAVVFAACDMPFLDDSVLLVLAAARARSRDAVVFPAVNGVPEPLCAAFAPGLAPRLEEYLKTEKDLAVMAFAKRAGYGLLELADTPALRLSFTNLNTKEELARAEELCRRKE